MDKIIACSLKCIDPSKIKEFNRHIERYKDSLTNENGIISEENVMKYYFYLNNLFNNSLSPYQIINNDYPIGFINYFSNHKEEWLGTNNALAHCMFKNLALNFVKDHPDYSYIEDDSNCGLLFIKNNISNDKVAVLNINNSNFNNNNNKIDTYRIKYSGNDDVYTLDVNVPKDKYKDVYLVSIPYMLYKDGYITKHVIENLISINLLNNKNLKKYSAKPIDFNNRESKDKVLSKYTGLFKEDESKETNKTDSYIKIPVTPKDPNSELLILANAIAKRLDYIYKDDYASITIEKSPSKKENSTRPYDVDINIYSSHNESL